MLEVKINRGKEIPISHQGDPILVAAEVARRQGGISYEVI